MWYRGWGDWKDTWGMREGLYRGSRMSSANEEDIIEFAIGLHSSFHFLSI